MFKIAVVGGGITGLTAAALLAKAGTQVVLFEAGSLGGRARGSRKDDFAFNLGPHALYRKGAARSILTDLGLNLKGAKPPANALGIWRGALLPLPFTPKDAVSTPLLNAKERWAMMKWMAALPLLSPPRLQGMNVSQWLGSLAPAVRAVAGALVRVTSYVPDFETLDAGSAAAQLKRALGGVDYLDGSWQTIVDDLEQLCRREGVDIRSQVAVRKVRPGSVFLDQETLAVDAILLCVGPRVAAKLSGDRDFENLVEEMQPLHAACLDLGLSGHVDAKRRFALGVDEPTYVSVYSDVAKVAPKGTTLLHAAVYGARGDASRLREQLERTVELLVPDWRVRVVAERWLPRLTVAHDVPRAAAGGQRMRQVLAPDIWLAGDWVQSDFMLADAALDSARCAVASLLKATRQRESAA